MLALFPGQGSQYVGMGKELYASHASAREVFEEASDALHLNLKKLCFDGPESDLILTENTQPCLLTVSVAAFRTAQKELGFQPSAVAGHSLGEYSALVAAGTLSLVSAVRWVRERGLAMQKAVPPGDGKMAAVIGLADPLVEELCRNATTLASQKRAKGEAAALNVDAVVTPANFNSPGQVVIAGSADAVDEALGLIRTDARFAGGKAMPLAVSAPFHCKLMEPAKLRMAELFAASNEKPRAPICPYVPNRTARLTSEPGVVFELLVEQVDHPVLWKQSIQTLIEAGHARAAEFGPGKVLQGLAKRIAQPLGKALPVLPVGEPKDFSALEGALKEVAK